MATEGYRLDLVVTWSPVFLDGISMLELFNSYTLLLNMPKSAGGKRQSGSGASAKVTQKQVQLVRQKKVQLSKGGQKRQEKQFLAAGLLLGRSPEIVLRWSLFSFGGAIGCLILGLLTFWLLPYGEIVKSVALIGWIVPIGVGLAVMGPGIRLAYLDRKDKPAVFQGQMIGTSEVSPMPGLGILLVRNRDQEEQFLVEPSKLAKMPGNPIPLVINYTPRLRYVTNIAMMGRKTLERPPTKLPGGIAKAQKLMLAIPPTIALAALLVDEIISWIPLPNSLVHAFLAIALAVGAGAGSYFLLARLQREQIAKIERQVAGHP